MSLEDIIKPDGVLCNAHARSKKHCLEILSELLVRSIPDIAAEEIFERLIERERLGCTGLERGVAFPHSRVDGLAEANAALIKLTEPVNFDSADGQPVDLVFGLLVPSDGGNDHTTIIDNITRALRDDGLRARLREARTSSALFDTFVGASELALADQWQPQSA